MIIKILLTTVIDLSKLVREKGPGKKVYIGDIATTVLLKLFINGIEKGYTIDSPKRIRGSLLSNRNN